MYPSESNARFSGRPILIADEDVDDRCQWRSRRIAGHRIGPVGLDRLDL
jgi:hypothetical protein